MFKQFSVAFEPERSPKKYDDFAESDTSEPFQLINSFKSDRDQRFEENFPPFSLESVLLPNGTMITKTEERGARRRSTVASFTSAYCMSFQASTQIMTWLTLFKKLLRFL